MLLRDGTGSLARTPGSQLKGLMMGTVVAVLVFGIGLFFPPAGAFNIDIPSVITHRGPTGSMFGFSVAQHRDSNVSWILVGAPEADSRQPGIERAGAVYRCSCESSDTCQLVPFDRTGNNVVQNQQIDEKSGQWFGATVKSSGEDGIILACAPRYTWFTSNRKRRDPVGTCFVAKDSFTEFTEYSPCRTTKWGYHRQGSCQVGLGADVDPAGRRIFLGAVGSWYWQGQMFMIDSRKAAPGGARAPFYQFVPPGQLYSQSPTSRPDIRWTAEGPSLDDDSYLGYSVVSGEFSGDSDSDVAVGMPRGANLTGKVVIYSSDLVNIHNITGEQIGAYFGYALAVLDVDGDGLDDIVIGAPMYTDFQDTAMKIETGRVYVVYQNKRHKFKKWDSLDGTAHRGRFGTSLCNLGDINRDSYPDFAVGAPYDGIGRGAVYIFQGTKDGVRREFSQVIFGSNLPHPVSTFGFSLSGGRDLDGNGYPDLLVGAYESDIVTYFRSRPVVRVRSKLTFSSGKQINLEEKSCTLRDGTRVPCLPLSLCMSYDGFGADDVIDFNVQYILDSKKGKEPRMFFLNNEGVHMVNNTVKLRKTTEQCTNTQVYIRPQIRDKLTSLEAELRYSMIETRARHLAPVIDVTGSTTEKDSVSIKKDCGPDNVCVPDLRLSVTQSDSSFVMGSSERIWVGVEVYNNGEDSFESMLYVQVPPGLTYANYDRLDSRKDVPILCSAPSPATNHTLKCDIGNPLPAFARTRFRLIFQPKYGSEVKSAYEFALSVNSTNPEESLRTGDNVRGVSMPIRVETKIEVYGSPKPQPVRHNVSLYRGKEKLNESHIGPDVMHVYEVKCGGPSSIEEASVVILWPSFTEDGEHFLYLLEQPRVEGPAECEAVDNVNPLGLKLQRHTKFTSHSRDSTVVDGEGRQRNFTFTSEYSSEGGTYTQEYSNSTFETRKTSGKAIEGGAGRNGIVSSVEEERHGGRGQDHGSQGGSTSRSTSTSYGSRTYGGRTPEVEGSYRATSTSRAQDSVDTSGHRGGGAVYTQDSVSTSGHRGGGAVYTQDSVRTSGHRGGEAVYTQDSVSTSGHRGGGVSHGAGSGNGRVWTQEEVSTSGRSGGGVSHGAGSGNGRVWTQEEVSTSGRSGGGVSHGAGSGNGRVWTQEEVSTSGRSGGGVIHEEVSTSGRRGSVVTQQGSSAYRPAYGGGAYESEERSYSRAGGSGGYSSLEETQLGGNGNHGYGGRSSSSSFSQTSSRHGGGEETYSSSNGRGRGGNGRVSFVDPSDDNGLSRHRRADLESAYEQELTCPGSKCIRIHCKIGQLSSNSSVTFYLRARVYSDTLQSKFPGQTVEIRSKLLARVTQLPYNVSPDYLAFRKLEVVTTVEEEPDLTVSAPTPWWIYLIGIILGLLLLLLLIYLLYKCGFFKRRRPNPTPEGQPLHRNGYRDDRL